MQRESFFLQEQNIYQQHLVLYEFLMEQRFGITGVLKLSRSFYSMILSPKGKRRVEQPQNILTAEKWKETTHYNCLERFQHKESISKDENRVWKLKGSHEVILNQTVDDENLAEGNLHITYLQSRFTNINSMAQSSGRNQLKKQV